ncbi:hypothetical protein JHK82_047901 [Glycine max]|uniref:Uncharacterized protein n=2 Tax=Glycine subgen. Soja TaxID=1462606 RepID=A0A0R0FPZ6_SOYBN|nr:hypothetical protein JHK86_047789 [Glycine max]KAG4933599.1 hypothetical protein JHK87_047601 [Glycine soja]KAG4943759.1 hypothetical protein JHK85_048405 [Glycine max]KAG5098047.1 hypothetical protein JHK82_047901 [Glycine max]KAG5102840.1 hypothetical protein JHK84_047809 [Glycine max]
MVVINHGLLIRCKQRECETTIPNIINRCRLSFNQLSNFGMNFVRRQANLITHTLTKALRFYARSQFFNYVPKLYLRFSYE